MSGVPQQALPDYLAMTALAPINPHADFSDFDSILNLFTPAPERRPATGMTIWDQAYLQGLYSARPDAASARQHNAEIARRMADQIQSITNGEPP